MPLDPELEKAVQKAVHDLGQPDAVSKRLLTWLKEASEKNLQKEEEASRLNDIYEALAVKQEENE